MKAKFPRYFIVNEFRPDAKKFPKFQYYSLDENGVWSRKLTNQKLRRVDDDDFNLIFNWSINRKASREVSREELALILS